MEEKKLYMGIDPGKTGFITAFDGKEFHFYSMPTKKVENGEFTKTGKPKTDTIFDEWGLILLALDIRKTFEEYDIKIFIEEVIGRGGWSATNNFNFGYTAGMQKTLALIISQNITMVRPQKWQSLIRKGYKKILKPSSTGKTMINDPKAIAELIVKTEYPNIDFRKTERAKKNDDNKIDSFLICLYGYRINN